MRNSDCQIADEKTTDETREMSNPRTLAWFSCGDASAVACALTLRERSNVEVCRIIVPDEHEDSERFSADCERWYGVPIVRLQDTKKRSAYDVWTTRKYISGIKGAPCTGELKKAVRFAYQRPDDIHVMGFTYDEQRRAETLQRNNFELSVDFPLIRHKLRKDDCHALVRAQGIELHAMYLLGYENANCIGCCKGGAGYWNRIRQTHPFHFKRMAELSRRLGCKLVRQDGRRIFLDELREGVGRLKGPRIECGPFCEPVKEIIAAPRVAKTATGA